LFVHIQSFNMATEVATNVADDKQQDISNLEAPRTTRTRSSVVLQTTTDVNRIEAPVTFKAYMICAFASFGGIFFGYDSGYVNGVLGNKIFIENVEGPGATAVSSSHQSLIVSILSLGTFLGAIIGGDVADFIGRKWTVIMGCCIYILGVVIQMITHGSASLAEIVVGRVIAGIGVGFESAIVILYMSEIVSCLLHWHYPDATPLTLSVAGPAQSPWRPRRWIPVLYHHRHLVGVLRGLCHQEPHGYWCLQNPDCRPIRLGSHPRRWPPLPARLAQILCQEG